MNDKYMIPYMNACVRGFSKRFGLSLHNAFNYLMRFKGMQFLQDCYEAEHLVSVEDAVDDLTLVCQRNGGKLK